MSAVAPPDLPGVTHRWERLPSGLRLHVAEAGVEHAAEGPALVLLHGWPQHWWCWRKVIPLLAERHHVVAVDLRGHGWSDVPAPGGDAYDKRTLADDVIALLDVLGLERPVLVGHDWGAWVSLLVAGRAPGRVAGVVATAILAPWTTVPVRELRRFGYQLVAGGPIGPLAHRLRGQRFLRTVYRLGSHDRSKAWPEAEQQVYLERYRDPARARAGAAMYRRFLLAEAPAGLRGRYQAPVTDVPLLFLPGTRDGVLTPKLVSQALGPANVTVETIEGAGHWVPEEQPEALAAQVERFVAALPATAAV